MCVYPIWHKIVSLYHQGYTVHHETHRKRFLYSPWATREFLLAKGKALVALMMIFNIFTSLFYQLYYLGSYYQLNIYYFS